MTVMSDPLRRWYEYHREDYGAVKRRLAACRNVLLRGREDAAAELLRKSCVHAVLSIQTERTRHERAFTAYYAGDRSLETATDMTTYGNQKANWLYQSLGSFDFEELVKRVRETDGNGYSATHPLAYLVDNFKGLSYTKAGFALAMAGLWEVACPDTRTKQMLDIEGRIRSMADYRAALARIDEALPVEEPTFIKQWVLYDKKADEHARHMAFFTEALGPTVV